MNHYVLMEWVTIFTFLLGWSQIKICQILYQNITDVTGNKPRFVGDTAWMDSEIIWKKGIPTVNFGPRVIGSHAAVEYVELDSVIDSARILERTIVQFCRTDIWGLEAINIWYYSYLMTGFFLACRRIFINLKQNASSGRLWWVEMAHTSTSLERWSC